MSNKITKLISLIQLMLLLSVSSVSAQNHVPVVTNVDLQQRTDYSLIVDIYYDVFDADDDPMTVTILASSDSGGTWNLPCNNITGAIGSGITSGTGKHIAWNIGIEHPNFFSDKVIIEISADDGVPAVPVLVSPLNNAILLTVAPTFTWNSSATATSYTLQVSESNLFTSYVYNQSGLTGTSQQVTSLSDSTTYYWRVSATNNFGTSDFSSAWLFSTEAKICPGLPTITYSGKTYNTVQIGTQCWLKENLDVGVYVASTNTGITHSDVSNNGIIEKYCYGNNESNCATYGGLYDWNEAMGYVIGPGIRGICPPGWHIPTIADFQTLSSAVNNNSNALKAIGQGSGDGAGTNTSGFSALLSGSRFREGGFLDLGSATYFWSSSEYGYDWALYVGLYYNNSNININDYEKKYGFNVRCLKDNGINNF